MVTIERPIADLLKLEPNPEDSARDALAGGHAGLGREADTAAGTMQLSPGRHHQTLYQRFEHFHAQASRTEVQRLAWYSRLWKYMRRSASASSSSKSRRSVGNDAEPMLLRARGGPNGYVGGFVLIGDLSP